MNALSALEAEQSPTPALLMTLMVSRRGIRTGKFSSASWQSLHSLRHGDQCREDQVDDNTSSINKKIKRTESLDSHKLQVPGLSCIWRGFQAWDTPQDSADNSSIDKVTRLKSVWNDRSISLSSKIRLIRSLVTSIFLYACESWTLTAELQRRIQAMEMRCYRKILHVSYKDHVTNEEVRAKIQQAIGPHEDLLTIVKRNTLQWYGHVSRSSGLA